MLGLVVTLLLMVQGSAAQPQERVAEIRIQGNYRTPEDEIRRLASVQVGEIITADTLAAIESRLVRSGKFEDVEIRKRWRTIDSTEDIVLVIVVREVPGGSSSVGGRLAHAITHPLFLPIFDYTDGYGVTYGARFSPVNLLGQQTHVSVPITWGATRQAAIELNRPLASGPLTRVTSSIGISEHTNPFYDVHDTRTMLAVRGERAFGRNLRAGVSGALNDVSFGTATERALQGFSGGETFASWGADIAVDTRQSSDLPRNATYLQLGWERLQLDGGPIGRYRADARGYLGLKGSSVLAVRVVRAEASKALPAYEKLLLGGASSVRGFRAGYDAGDRLLTGSAELRMPLTSPVSFGRAGVSLFVDSGTVYDAAERLRDGDVRTGVGGGLFFSAAVFHLNVDVARGLGRGFHVHVSSGFQF
jgi:outer membrane protein assembly factor BamA